MGINSGASAISKMYVGAQDVTAAYCGTENILDGYDIILLAGQSNMAGRGTYSAGTDTTDARVDQFDGYSSSGTYRTIIGAVDRLKHPEIGTVNVGQTLVGPGMFFGKAYAAATGRKVLLVPASWGGTSVVNGTVTWSPTVGGQDREYLNAIDQANRAVTAAVASYPNSRFVGTLWLQGEGDGANSVSKTSYQSALALLIAGFRAGITGATNSWFVIGQMMPEAIATQGGTYESIDAAHKELVSSTVYTSFAAIGSGYNSGDNLHYSAAGARLMGMEMASKSISARNRTTSIVPGQPTSLTAGSASDSAIPLTWSAPYDAGVVTDYIVEYKLTASGTWLTFSDGTSVTPASTVTGLTASSSYDFRVSATNAAGAGTVSSTVTASTIASVVESNVRFTTFASVSESGNAGAGYSYSNTTTGAFTAIHAGTSDKKLAAGTNGGIKIALPGTPNGGKNILLGVVTSQSDPLYNAGASGYKYGILDHSGGVYKLIKDGGAASVAPTTSISILAGDVVQLRRASGVWVAEVARSATPTVFTVIYTFPTSDNNDVWFAASFNIAASTITRGPLIGLNVT